MIRHFSRSARAFGAINEAGGSFKRKERAVEDQFIHDHEKDMVKNLKQKLKDGIYSNFTIEATKKPQPPKDKKNMSGSK